MSRDSFLASNVSVERKRCNTKRANSFTQHQHVYFFGSFSKNVVNFESKDLYLRELIPLLIFRNSFRSDRARIEFNFNRFIYWIRFFIFLFLLRPVADVLLCIRVRVEWIYIGWILQLQAAPQRLLVYVMEARSKNLLKIKANPLKMRMKYRKRRKLSKRKLDRRDAGQIWLKCFFDSSG